jgi:ABC-type Fe3+-hydroxamate transport system substrate-binding protein
MPRVRRLLGDTRAMTGESSKLGLVVALALAALLAAGCGERSEPTGSRVALFPVTVENAHGAAPIARTSAPHRIAALDAEGLQILRALGVKATLAADAHGNPRRALITQLRPELLVAGPSNDPLRLRRLEARLDVPVYVCDGSSIAGVERSILELGRLTGRPVHGRAIVVGIARTQAAIAAQARGSARPTVFVDLGLFNTDGADSYLGELIRAAGGRDIVGASVEPGPVRPERLVMLDPDVYIASSDAGTTLADLRGDPSTRTLRAVKTGRFALVRSALLEPGPRIAEALRRLAAALHERAQS